MVKAGLFHHLPSGGAIRVAGQQLYSLRGSFHWTVRVPAGSSPLLPPSDVPLFEYPFPESVPLAGSRRLLGPVLLWRKLTRLNTLCRAIAEDFEGDGVECILAHNSMTIAAPPLLLYSSIPTIYFCHEYPRHIYERGIHKTRSLLGDLLISPLLQRERRQDRRTALRSDLIVVNSFFTARKVEKAYGRTPVVSYPGIDTGLFSPAAGERGGFVLSVGALSPFKGHHLIVRAIGRLPADARPPLTIVAGRSTGEYALRLERTAAAGGVDLTIRTGITDSDLRDLYHRAAVTVCASENEPYGLVPLEAMACGCPVLAVDQGGFPENVKDGETGITVPRTVRGLTDGIQHVLGMDGPDKHDMISRALEFVSTRRTIKSEAETMEAFLNAVAGRSQDP